jgi:hypothetical protein
MQAERKRLSSSGNLLGPTTVASLNGLAFIPARHCADSLLLGSPTESGFDRSLRMEDRRQRLVLFPASAKGLVQDHKFVGCGRLGSRMLVLQGVFRALGVENVCWRARTASFSLRRRSP